MVVSLSSFEAPDDVRPTTGIGPTWSLRAGPFVASDRADHWSWARRTGTQRVALDPEDGAISPGRRP